MANSTEHILTGAVLGVLIGAGAHRSAGRNITTEQVLKWGFYGACGAAIPDILEPATNPSHRKMAHSMASGSGLVYVAKSVWDNSTLRVEQKADLLALSGGYLSHLLLDADTPAGLPIL